jgi:hypothetical protein
MARSIERRSREALGTFRSSSNVPGLQVTPTPYFSPPKGINTLAAVSRIPNEFSPLMSNLILDEGVLRSRKGLEQMDLPASPPPMAALVFTAQDGISVIVRVTTNHLWTWNGSDWIIVDGPLFTGTVTDKFSFTGWGNELLIANGVDKIASYNVSTGVLKTLEESPPARHITSFNGRVLASCVVEGSLLPYRQRWCVKLNNEDWTSETTTDGIGAGYEDSLATPGGSIDEIMGTFPISDDTAVMVRENSIWLQFVTGDVLSPFRFTRMVGAKGSRARHSIQITPYGVVVLTQDDVIVVSNSGWESIGESIRRQLHSEIVSYPNIVSTYDPLRQEYRLGNASAVWRFSFVDKGWTKDTYNFDLRYLSFIDYKALGLTFDELEGTFDELEGTFDELVKNEADDSIFFTSTDGRVLREEDDATNDAGLDSSLEIRTGLLQGGSYLDKTELIEAQLEYECAEIQTLFFEYSLDKGTTWNNYSQIEVNPTTEGLQRLAS